jgi:hypothetical protein
MRNHLRIGLGAGAVALLLSGAVMSQAPASASPQAAVSITVDSVGLFTPTDADSAPGYLQAALVVSYTCNDAGAVLDGIYGPASHSVDDTSTTCNGANQTATLFAQVPETSGAKPVKSGVTYDYGASIAGNLEGSGTDGPMNSAVLSAAPNGAPTISDMYPPYDFHLTNDQLHPASRVIAHWLPPLTTGSHTLTGFDVHNYNINLHATVGPTATKYVIKGLKPHHKYGFGMNANASGYGSSALAVSITTLPKANADLSLHENHHDVPPGHKVKLSGRLKPAHSGKIKLQRRTHGHWKTFAAARLHHGAFHHRIRVGTSDLTIRAVVSSTPDVTRGTSGALHISVGS